MKSEPLERGRMKVLTICSPTLPALLAMGSMACRGPRSPDVAGPPRSLQASKDQAAGSSQIAPSRRWQQTGTASLYRDWRTASGERYNARAMAAGHKTLPFGSRVEVTNLHNGRSVIVRINDRGPYVARRIIDLTPAAAAKIGLGWRQGLARVRIERL